MMLHVTADVTGRTIFNHPIEGTTEIVSAYYMVAVAYLPWAWIARNDRHIHVDMFTIRMPLRPKLWLEIAVKIVTFLYVGLFTWRTTLRAISQTRSGEVWIAGTNYIPVWPSRWILPIAGALMVIYLVARVSSDVPAGAQTLVSGAEMSALQLAAMSLVCILTLIALRIPIGVALGGVSFFGFWYLRNVNVALSVLEDTPFVFSASWDLTAIPMFLLMGAIANGSGISSALFRAARVWFGGMPGGLAVATNMACAGFAAACGSSVAAAAAMARLAIPEMLKQGYDKGLAAGVVASAGTLAALIPPSILFVLYGIFAEVSIAKLLIAGVLPGLLTAAIYAVQIVIRCKLDPSLGAA